MSSEMAEKEEGRVPVQKRNPTYSNRGHPGQNRLYNQLGVKDLRELLDRKRNERGYHNEPPIPPPDPSYNYLKDPLRENEDNNPHEPQTRPNNTRKYYNKNNPSNNQKQRESHSGNVSKNQDIENPVNIKVEFSASTGEHVYKMDETTILPTIKHVPDRLPSQNRSYRGRGRGRGGSRGQQRTYHTRTIRSNNLDKRTPRNNVFDEKQTPTEHSQPVLANNAEENWDDELNKNENVAIDEGPSQDDVEESLEAAVENLNLNEDKENTNEDKSDDKVPEEKE